MQRTEPWTQDEIVKRIRDAGETVRRMPRPRGPQGSAAAWPEVVHDAREAYGYSEGGPKPPCPSSRAIDRADEVFSWFRFLGDHTQEMRAMWLAVGCGRTFAHTGRILGVTRKTIRARVWAAIERIVQGLNRINEKGA